MQPQKSDFDVLVIGSGFGGSVTALRLTEKGYKVGVLEAGPRFEDEDFASGTFDLKRYLWAPALGCYGIQRIDALRDTLIVAGAGVGGGSLVYANTLYEPLDAFYHDPQWADITDWKDELAPYYDQAKRMLGVVDNPVRTPADDVMEKVADRHGRRRHVPPDAGRRVLRRARAAARRRRSRTRTSAARAPSATPASTAASACPAAGTTPRTPWSRTTSTSPRSAAPRCCR